MVDDVVVGVDVVFVIWCVSFMYKDFEVLVCDVESGVVVVEGVFFICDLVSEFVNVLIISDFVDRLLVM